MRLSAAGCVSVSVALVVFSGCRQGADDTADIAVKLDLDPSPPIVGKADVTLALSDEDNEPLSGAEVRLEGNMNHAGMVPTFADLREESPGRYVGELDFTMGGDWFILVTAQLPDGGRLERKIDVPGVKAP